MSNATNLSKLANLLDDGTTGQALVSDGTSNVAFETLNTSNVSEGTNLYFTDERVQTKLGSVSGNVVPDTNVAYDLGSAAYAFKDLYLSGSTINLGSLQLSDNGGSLEISPTGGGSAEPFATQAYVTTQVNNLVDAAPGTLDTLNELAAALGDDANFSTTVTNSIAAKANTSSLATVATSGSFSDLTGKPTTIAGYGITDAGGGGGGNVVEYTSTNTAATNDIVMLNSDGTVTVVEPTNYAFDQQTAIDSQMTSGYLADLNYRGMIAHHSTREKGMLIFPGGTGHNDRTMLVVFSRNGSAISKGTAFSSGEPINNFRDQHAFFGPAGAHEDKFLYLGASTSGGNINVGTGNITGTTVNTTGTDSSAAYSNTTNNGQLNIGLNGRMAVDHGGFNGTVLTFYVKFENSNSKAAVRKFTYDFANQNLDYSFPEIETSSSETFEWEHTAIDPSTPTRIALYRQEGATSTRRGIIKFADVDWGTGTINIGPSADLFTRSGSHNVDAYEIQNKQAFHPTNGLLAAVTTSPADGGGDAPYRLKVALYSADANLSITNVSGNLTLINGANVKVGTVIGNIAWTKGSNTGSTPNAPILITPIISNQIGSSPQTRYLQYDNSGNYITQTTDSNTFDAGSMWTYSSPFNDGDTASYSPDTVNSQYPQVIMTQGPYGESNFDATKLHGVAASAGTTIDVTLEHGIHTGLSGLTTGTKYFVTDSGGISTSGSAKLGTAINATSLALDFTDELTSADLGTYATKAYVGTEIAIKANTADLATVATSGSYNDLTNQPTIPTNNNQLTNGAGYVTSAQLVGDSTVISYSSTSSASANDVMMLNTDGTVTPVEVTTFNKNFNLANSGSAHPETADANDPVTVGTIPDNRNMVIHAYHKNGHLHLRTASYTGNTITYGSEIDTNQYVDRVMIFVDEFDTSKFILFYTKNSNFLYARSGEIVGTSIQLYDNNGVNNNLSAGAYGGGTDGIAGQPAGAQKHHQIIYGHGECSSGNMVLYLHYAVGNSYSVERLTWDSSNLGAGSTGTGIDSNMRSQNRVYIVDNETENLHRLMGIAGALPSFDLDPRDPTKFVYSYIKGTSGSDYRTAIRAGTIDWTAKTSTRGNEYELFTRSSGNFHQDAFQAKVRIHPDNSKILTLFSVPAGVGGNLSSGETGALNGWFFERDSLDNLTVFCKGKIAGSSSQVIDYLEYPLRQEQVVISHGSTEPHLHLITRTWNGVCEKKILKFSLPASQNLTHNTWDGSTTGSSSQQNATNFAPSILSPNANERVGSTNSGSFINNKQRAAVVDYHIPQSTSKPFLTFTQHTYVESNLDKSKIHGLAATSGTTPDVTTQFGVHSGLSGLTVGSKYYVLDDGTLSTTPDTHNAKIGVAVKATHIALDFIDELTVSDLATYATKAYVGTEIAIKANTADLATVATSGSYNDLTNQPTIPSLSGYATETYVNTATANLVDSAPATLDTLNELAAALGDDANFSTTILAQLGAVSANTITNASNINAVQANLSASASTAAVTVSGGNFYIDGAQQTTISLEPGRTYKFDQSDSTNSSHPLRFSTTSDGTHGGGSEYTTGVTTSGTAGSANAYVQIAIDNSTPALYYYCTNHSGMGAAVSVGNPFNTDELSEGTNNLYYTDARVDARISGGVSANLNITSSPTKKYARLELTSNQSINSQTQTIINFNTRSEDTSTANLLTTSLGSGKFIIPAGVTKVRLKASAEGSNVTEQFILKITKNGSNAITSNFDIASTGSDHAAVFTGIENVVEGDYFQVSAYSQQSRTVNAGSFTWFELEVLEGSILDTTVSANVALADLNNVSNAAPADGQALIWNTSQSNWAPANVAAGGSTVSVSDTAPSSPSNGDQWFNSADGSMYVYYTDGSSNQWVSVSGPAGSSVSVGTTPPTGAASGDQWFNSDSATLYVYYADGSSSQWVAVSGPIGPQGPAVENAVTTGKAIAMSIVFG